MQQQKAKQIAYNMLQLAAEFEMQLVEEFSAYNCAQLQQIANALQQIARKQKHNKTLCAFTKSAALAYVQHAKYARIK